MNGHTWIIAGVAVALLLFVKRLTLVRPNAARDWLEKGAKVIDVRSEEEYRGGHLHGAINVPFDRLRHEIRRLAPDKEQPLLLHCLSGARSGMGKASLRRMGYRHVFNLGSYGRAAKIVGAQSNHDRKG